MAQTWARLADPTKPAVVEMRAAVADAMGLSEPQVAESLRREALRWTSDRIAEMLAREIAPFEAGRIRPQPVNGALVIPASTVPFAGLESVSAAVLAGAPVAICPSRRNPEEIIAFHAALQAQDPGLAELVTVLDRDGLISAAGAAETVVVHGGAQVIKEVRGWAAPNARVVAYGPRWSLVALDLADANDSELVGALAQDTLLYDSLGCMTPRVILVPADQRDVRLLADVLGQALGAAARRFPPHPDVSRRPLQSGPAAAGIDVLVRSSRGLESVRQHGTARMLLAGPATDEEPGVPRVLPTLRRCSLLVAVDPDSDPRRWLSDDLDPLSTVGIGPKLRASSLGKSIERLALSHQATRLTSPSRLQTLPAGWPHDGQPNILPFLRLTTPG